MINLKYSEVSQTLCAEMKGSDGVVGYVSADTRDMRPGATFVALKGKKYDAHDFIGKAIESGASALIVEQEFPYPVTQIIVDDTCKALGDLAKMWRMRFDIPVIGVTGSNGKTTVKEMLFSIFSEKGPTLSTSGNLNNHIGVPLTLLRLDRAHRFAVIEMGANHPGEIAYLAKIVLPNIALITNAGPAHLQGFGNVEGVARAKGEIFSSLPSNGIAIFNEDDKYADIWRAATVRVKQVGFSMQKEPHGLICGEYKADNVFALKTPYGEQDVKLPLRGLHNGYNALAAAAAALSAGLTLCDIAAGMQKMNPVPGRLVLIGGINGMTILDDTYNANPASVEAGLKVLTSLQGEHWLILGDMGELGVESDRMHRDIGSLAKNAGVHCLFTLGNLSAKAAETFGDKAFSYRDEALLTNSVIAKAGKGINILVKGSRSMRMERIVERLTDSACHTLRSDTYGRQ